MKPLTIAARLQQLLDERKWTAYMLAKESGVSQNVIGRCLHGQMVPHFENIQAIAKALKVSLSVFDHCVTGAKEV
jgi:transcriptional regulator with XRE-family HTH domain